MRQKILGIAIYLIRYRLGAEGNVPEAILKASVAKKTQSRFENILSFINAILQETRQLILH